MQDDLYPIGTKAVIRKMSRSEEGHLELLVMGMERVAMVKLDHSEPFLKAREEAAKLEACAITFRSDIERSLKARAKSSNLWLPRYVPRSIF